MTDDIRPRTHAAAHFAQTGTILPGEGAAIARFLRERREGQE